MKVSEVIKGTDLVLPVVISIKYDDGQMSMRKCYDIVELEEYASNRMIANSETVYLKEVGQITYIDALSDRAYQKKQIKDRNNNKRRNRRRMEKKHED